MGNKFLHEGVGRDFIAKKQGYGARKLWKTGLIHHFTPVEQGEFRTRGPLKLGSSKPLCLSFIRVDACKTR